MEICIRSVVLIGLPLGSDSQVLSVIRLIWNSAVYFTSQGDGTYYHTWQGTSASFVLLPFSELPQPVYICCCISVPLKLFPIFMLPSRCPSSPHRARQLSSKYFTLMGQLNVVKKNNGHIFWKGFFDSQSMFALKQLQYALIWVHILDLDFYLYAIDTVKVLYVVSLISVVAGSWHIALYQA